MVISEKYRCQEDSPPETHLNGSIHDLALCMAFFLCKCGHEGKHHLAFGVKGIEPFRFKEHSDRVGKGKQLTDIPNAVHDISCKTRYAFCNDKIYLALFTILDHQLELVTVLQGSTGNTFIRIDLYEFPVRTFTDNIMIVVFLQFVRGCLSRIIRGYPCIYGNTLFVFNCKDIFLRKCRNHVKFIKTDTFITFPDLIFLVGNRTGLMLIFVHD